MVASLAISQQKASWASTVVVPDTRDPSKSSTSLHHARPAGDQRGGRLAGAGNNWSLNSSILDEKVSDGSQIVHDHYARLDLHPLRSQGNAAGVYQDSIAMTREDNSRKPTPDLGAADIGDLFKIAKVQILGFCLVSKCNLYNIIFNIIF